MYEYLSPVLSIRLIELGFPQETVAYFFLIGAVTNISSSLTLSFVKMPFTKRSLIIFGLLSSTVSNLLMGPSALFHFPQTLLCIGFGQALLGIFNPFLLINCLTEMVDVIEMKFPDLDEQSKMKIYDNTSGLYNTMLGMGEVLGPIYATAVAESRGFSSCCDYVALASLTLGILYIVFTKNHIAPSHHTKSS
jgi:hypothetical protein